VFGGMTFQVHSRLIRLNAGHLNVAGEAFILMSRDAFSRRCYGVQSCAQCSHRLEVRTKKFSVFFAHIGLKTPFQADKRMFKARRKGYRDLRCQAHPRRVLIAQLYRQNVAITLRKVGLRPALPGPTTNRLGFGDTPPSPLS
jgi:hypothetical protein